MLATKVRKNEAIGFQGFIVAIKNIIYLFSFVLKRGDFLMYSTPMLALLDYEFLSNHLITISISVLTVAFVTWVFKSFVFSPDIQRNCAHAVVLVALGYGVVLLSFKVEGFTPQRLLALAASLPFFIAGLLMAFIGIARLRTRRLKGGRKTAIGAILLGGLPLLAAGLGCGVFVTKQFQLYGGLPKFSEAEVAAGRARFPRMNFEVNLPPEKNWVREIRSILRRDFRSPTDEVVFEKGGTNNMLKFVSTHAGSGQQSAITQLVRSATKLQAGAVDLKGYSPSEIEEVEINGYTFQHNTLTGLVGRDSFFGEFYSILHDGEFFQIIGISQGIKRTDSFSAELREVVESFSFIRSSTSPALRSSGLELSARSTK